MRSLSPLCHRQSRGHPLLSSALNWTSTKVPLWQIDCDEYRKLRKPFELRDVTTEEHKVFAVAYSSRFDLEYKFTESAVVFSPRTIKPAADSRTRQPRTNTQATSAS